jgi:hypothetical protein
VRHDPIQLLDNPKLVLDFAKIIKLGSFYFIVKLLEILLTKIYQEILIDSFLGKN